MRRGVERGLRRLLLLLLFGRSWGRFISLLVAAKEPAETFLLRAAAVIALAAAVAAALGSSLACFFALRAASKVRGDFRGALPPGGDEVDRSEVRQGLPLALEVLDNYDDFFFFFLRKEVEVENKKKEKKKRTSTSPSPPLSLLSSIFSRLTRHAIVEHLGDARGPGHDRRRDLVEDEDAVGRPRISPFPAVVVARVVGVVAVGGSTRGRWEEGALDGAEDVLLFVYFFWSWI